MSETSTKPYLLRALYEWCMDNGYTPHIAVYVDRHTRVPREFVNNNEIILNISADASHQLQMKNDWIDFNARFNGRAHKIEIPVANILAIYALENGQGMAFPVEKKSDSEQETVEIDTQAPASEPATSDAMPPEKKDEAKADNKNRRGHLTIIK